MYLKRAKEVQIVDDFSMFLSVSDYVPSICSRIKDISEIAKEAAFILAKTTNWEGDGDMYIFPLYSESSDKGFPDFGIIVKQNNNGATFIVTPW